MKLYSLVPLAVILASLLSFPMSAYGVVYVKWDSPGPTFDGTSWETAFHGIQEGIDVAGDAVYVAQGTYAKCLTLKDGVMLYGGYSGVGDQRDPAVYVTVIDGGSSTTLPAITCANISGLDGFTIQHGQHGVYASGKTGVVIANNTITQNAEVGVYLSGSTTLTITSNTLTANMIAARLPSSSGALTVAGNTASGNRYNKITLSQPVISADSHLESPTDTPFQVVGTVQINAGKTLTIGPGTVVKLSDKMFSLNINGRLSAIGTSDSPICFTSSNDDSISGDTDGDGGKFTPRRGDWGIILIAATGASATLDHCIIRYGGGYLNKDSSVLCLPGGSLSIANSIVSHSKYDGVSFQSPAAALVTGCTITDCGRSGLAVKSNQASLVVTNNTFHNNVGDAATLISSRNFTLSGNTGSGNGCNGIVLTNCMLYANTQWHPQPGFPYVVAGQLIVMNGATLTIDPGSVVKLGHTIGSSEYTPKISINGNLAAVGTLEAPIYFTSIKDDFVGGDTNNDGAASIPERGDWDCITAGYGSVASLKYSVVRYGGSTTGYEIGGAGRVSLTNCDVTHSKSKGVYGTGNTEIMNSIIAYNLGTGVTPSYGICCDLWMNGTPQTLDGWDNIAKDPQFVGLKNGDFRLGASSPCIGAGIIMNPDDFRNHCDIGALPPKPSVAFAKSHPDKFEANIEGAVVTLCTGVHGPFCYIEDPDGLAGIKVTTLQNLQPNTLVDVQGTLATIDGERVLQAMFIMDKGPTTPIAPWFVNPNTLGGGPLWYQTGVQDWRLVKDPITGMWSRELVTYGGANNIGLLVKVAGRIEQIGPGFFYLNDSTSYDDGNPEIRGVRVAWPFSDTPPTIGTFVEIVGISACTQKNHATVRLLRPLSAESVSLMEE